MNKINKVFLALLCVELVIGGGGRLLDPLGIFPIRYVFFGLSFVLLMLNVVTFNLSINQFLFNLLIYFFLFPLYGCFIGAVSGNELSDILYDAQPYMFMLLLLYIFTLKDDLKKYLSEFFLKTVNVFSLYASLIYIAYVIMLKLEVLNFLAIYDSLSLTNEFFFRPDGAFFAKSFYFLGIGAIVRFVNKKYKSLFIIMLAILLTESRGVLLFTLLSLLFASFRLHRFSFNLLLVGVGFALFIIMLSIVGSRGGDSDSVRFSDFYFYYDNLDLINFIFGTGFGTFILDRLRIEVVPLEILQKTGVIGVAISLLPLIYIFVKGYFYKKTKSSLIMSCILLFSICVSITNPFLYTPMGIFVIGVVVSSLFSLNHVRSTNDVVHEDR